MVDNRGGSGWGLLTRRRGLLFTPSRIGEDWSGEPA